MINEQQKKTAYDSSAGTDDKRSANKSNNSIAENMDDCNISDDDIFGDLGDECKAGYICSETLGELLNKRIDTPPALIEGMLYEGAYIFAGPPKVGKSFLVYQIGYHIANGMKFWGREVKQGKVVYLSLEDNEARLQNRFNAMFGDYESNENNLIFCLYSEKIGKGLEQQLEYLNNKYGGISLFIVDTLQMVRSSEEARSVYNSDYALVNAFHNLAYRLHTSILIVHHTRKAEAENPFDLISGSNGIRGASDGNFVLIPDSRNIRAATLYMQGRDGTPNVIKIKYGNPAGWEFVEEENDVYSFIKDPLVEKITNFINRDNPHWKGTCTELAKEINSDLNPRVIGKKLNVIYSILRYEYNILITDEHTRDARLVEFTLQN